MNSLLVVSRALHFAAVLLMFGGLLLSLVVVAPATRTSQAGDVNERVRGFLRAAGWWGLGVSLLSGVAWLFLEAALMSGQPIAEVTEQRRAVAGADQSGIRAALDVALRNRRRAWRADVHAGGGRARPLVIEGHLARACVGCRLPGVSGVSRPHGRPTRR